MLNYKDMEEKWQKQWSEAKVFESEPNEKNGILVTAPFPYVNTPLHIGHLRTYATTDLYSRYMRMKGFNVLFPFAFHASGTPILAIAKRLMNNDKELIDDFRSFKISDEDIAKMRNDPLFIANYFIKNVSDGMHKAGLGIDWRRRFVSIDPIFGKMVTWQFGKLKELGYLEKGMHPVGWCTNDQSAVGQHDTKHDVHPEIKTMIVVEFKDAGSDAYFACATYRPETIYAVTNIFVGKEIQYVIARMNNKRYYISKETAQILSNQASVKIEGEVSADELLKKSAVNPITKETVPVLPGFFVKPDVGTGIVMSVPSHAPFDYAALERLKTSGYPIPKIEYKRIIDIEPLNGNKIGRSLGDVIAGEAKPLHPEIPALAYLEILNSDPNAIDDMLEFATKLAYREESHWGVMLVGKYSGMKEPEAREKIKSDLIESNDGFDIFVIGNDEPVYCRCGTKVIVKVVDQWFINYGNKKWKKEVNDYLPNMKIYPKKLSATFSAASDWLDLRAAERAQGLGTKFPFDERHIIESLSDSTIYPTLYTYIHILYSNGIKPEQLIPEFFDYVLLGKGNVSSVSQSTKIDTTILNKCRESVQYWYKNTSRHSAPDLIYNHYVMYIYNHVALFPKEFWPRQIVVNGMVNYEGEKMSKSLGNIVPLSEGIEKYGSDPLRFVEIAGGDLDTETEFSPTGINSIVSKNQYLFDMVLKMEELDGSELTHIDYWLYSRLNSKIKNATESLDGFMLRGAYTDIYYNSITELKWYMDRGGNNGLAVREFIEKIALMLGPIMPHFAEELWNSIGNNTLVAKERWPTTDETYINKPVEKTEEIIKDTIDDINNTVALTSRMPQNSNKRIKEIKVIVSDDWKSDAYNALAEKRNISEVMKMQWNAADKEKVSKFLSQLSKKIRTIEKTEFVKCDSLFDGFSHAKAYLSKRLGSSVAIEKEQSSGSSRAERAMPNKPSIDVVWS